MANYVCNKCGKSMEEINFYTYRDGSKTEMCKKCLTMHIDNFNPETYLWLLEKMDVPYVEEEWNILRDRAFAKNPHKMNGMSVFGKYLSKMKLKQWKQYTWADTERLRDERKANLGDMGYDDAAIAEIDAQLKEQLEKGEITEAQYQTLASVEKQAKELPPPPLDYGGDGGYGGFFDESQFMSEDELPDPGSQLTEEDKIYLAMKWGRLYKPNEWVELEKKYNEMTDSFDIQDSDTVGALILICKTYLKMNQAIDCGDMDGYQKLSRVYDSLRKSAKFTAAQNKEQKADFIDSLGEMVAYCERVGGVIPRYEITVDYDIVDKVIRDLKDYNKSLVYEDSALARQIEDYLKKRDSADSMKKDREEARAAGREVEVSDEDHIKLLEMIEEDKLADQAVYYNSEEESE